MPLGWFICPICLNVSVNDGEEGEVCNQCDLGELVSFDEYMAFHEASSFKFILDED